MILSKKNIALENIIGILYNMEKELDTFKSRTEEMRRKLIISSQEEAEKTRIEAIENITEKTEKELNLVKSQAEKKSKTILVSNEEKIKDLKSKIQKNHSQAINLVIKAVLGEEL